jgi:hypothetical protein
MDGDPHQARQHFRWRAFRETPVPNFRQIIVIVFAGFVGACVALLQGCYASHGRLSDTDGDAPYEPDAVVDVPVTVDTADASSPFADSPFRRDGVTVVCQAYPESEALRETTTGTTAYTFYGFRVIPHGRPIRLPSAQFDFGWDGRSLAGQVFGAESGRPYFTNWTLTADHPFRIFNYTDLVSFRPAVEARRAVVFIDMRTWTEGGITEDTLIRLHADIAATEEGTHTLTLGRYTTRLVAISLYYADAPDEVVPIEDVHFVGCDREPGAPVLVRLAEADIVVDRLSGESSETVTSGAGRVTFLRLLALNDGASNGTLDRIAFDTRAVVIPGVSGMTERPASIRDGVSACHLMRAGRTLAVGRFEGEQVVFDHANVTVTTADRGTSVPGGFAAFEVACDVQLNDAILPLYGALRIWFAADARSGFTLVEPTPARVQGTLVLEQNALGLDGSKYVQIVR